MPHQRLLTPLAATLAALLLIATPSAGAAPPRLASAAAFRDSVGVATHPSYFNTPYGQWNRVVARLRELGVHHIRGSFFASGNAGWNARQAQNFRTAYAAGIRANVVLDRHCSPSGRVDPCLSGMKTELPRGSVESVEWLNEDDLFGGPGWKPVLQSWGRDLYRRVKADPVLRSLRVVGPSLVAPNAPAVLGDQSAYLDVGNLHPYTGGLSPDPGHTLAEERRMRPVSGDKPLVATEAGFHTSPLETNGSHPPTDEPTAAVYTLRTVLEHFADGIDRTYLYELLDQRAAPLDSYSNFGLLHADFSPKPAFTQLRRLLSMIGSSAPPSAHAARGEHRRRHERRALAAAPAGGGTLRPRPVAHGERLGPRRPPPADGRAPARDGVGAPGRDRRGRASGRGHHGAGHDAPRGDAAPRAGGGPGRAAAGHPPSGRPGRPGRPPPRPAAPSAPAGARLSRIRVHHTGGRWWVTFRLSARARVRRTLHRRGHRVRRATTRALRPGRHRVGLGRLRAGRYRLRLAVAGRARPVVAGAVRFRVR